MLLVLCEIHKLVPWWHPFYLRQQTSVLVQKQFHGHTTVLKLNVMIIMCSSIQTRSVSIFSCKLWCEREIRLVYDVKTVIQENST